MDERFGPVGNERYRQYLKDIHTSGGHLISLLNDLLDLSKIEAGKLELTFVSVNLNDLVQQCVAIMQQQANRERVIIRTSLPPNLPQIVADARSVRQIALNLLSNSIKFTGAGGQVIVSTALNDDHEVVLRVRDTGPGMSEKELQTALEPFRQLATSQPRRRHRARAADHQGARRGQPCALPHHQPGRRRHAGGGGLPGHPRAGAITARSAKLPIRILKVALHSLEMLGIEGAMSCRAALRVGAVLLLSRPERCRPRARPSRSTCCWCWRPTSRAASMRKNSNCNARAMPPRSPIPACSTPSAPAATAASRFCSRNGRASATRKS